MFLIFLKVDISFGKNKEICDKKYSLFWEDSSQQEIRKDKISAMEILTTFSN